MVKSIHFIFIILLSLKGLTQEEVLTSNELGKKLGAYDQAVNFERIDNTILLSYIGEKNITIHENTTDFSKSKNYLFTKKTLEYQNYLGSYGNKEDRVFVYAKNSNKKFLTLKFNLTTKTNTEKKLEFKLKNQHYLGHFTYQDNFYIISLIKNTRTFKLTRIDLDSNFKEIDINIEEGDFLVDGVLKEMPSVSVSSSGISSDKVLNFGTGSIKTRTMSEMKNQVPNPNSEVTKNNKLYLNNNELLITLDSNLEATTLVSIYLDSFKSVTQLISKKPDFKVGSYTGKTNSYIHEKILYQMKGDKNKASLFLFDLEKKSTKTLIQFDAETPYDPENNLIISEKIRQQHAISIPLKQKDENVQKRLRKIMKTANNVGFQITENQNTLLITLGAYLERSSGTGGFGGGGFGAGAGIPFSLGFNTTFIRDESLNFFVDKTDYSLTYSNFESPYDRMKTYLNKRYNDKAIKKTKWLQKFKIGTDYYLGFLDKKTKEYQFVKFN